MTPPAAAAVPGVHRGRASAPPRPRVAPPRPRRVSGPARSAPRVAPRPAQAERGVVLGLLELISGISRSRALDRLIRGRAWIALIAFALIGIVMLQLLVLQLNASIGRALVREAGLQRENAALSIEGSELAGGERVESQAARLGMELVPVGALRFLTSDPRADLGRAAAALNTPVHGSSAISTEAAATSASATSTDASSTASAESSGAPQSSGEQAAQASAAAATEAPGSAAAASATTQASGEAPTSPSASPQASTAATGEAQPTGAAGATGGVGATQADGAG